MKILSKNDNHGDGQYGSSRGLKYFKHPYHIRPTRLKYRR